jgi:hypothetical protein
MRRIKHIVVHCTATPQTTSVDSIRRYWREVLGWRNPGYHILIRPDGTFIRLAQDSQVCNGVGGHNANSLHVSYIGGQHRDDRTDAQNLALLVILREWATLYPNAEILGHRDFAGVKKECPRFDTKAWLKFVGF